MLPYFTCTNVLICLLFTSDSLGSHCLRFVSITFGFSEPLYPYLSAFGSNNDLLLGLPNFPFYLCFLSRISLPIWPMCRSYVCFWYHSREPRFLRTFELLCRSPFYFTLFDGI